MANTTGVTDVAGGVAVAERVAEAHALWLSSLPTIRRAPVGDLVPMGELEPLTEPVAVPAVTVVQSLPAVHGPISDLAVSPDGRHLVAAHYAADLVSIIDTVFMAETAAITDVTEPYAVTVADRAYVSTASTEDDAVTAIDLKVGVALAAKTIDTAAGGLATSPSGDVLYVARTGDEGADIAAVDVETGDLEALVLSNEPAAVDALQVSTDGIRLYAALTTASGGALAVVNARTRDLENTIAVGGSIGDIAVHPSGRTAYVTGWDAELGGAIHVIDVVAGRVTDTIGVGGVPTHLVLGRDGESLYFVDRDEIVVLCTITNEIVDTIVPGGQLSCLAASPDGTRLYAADYAGGITVLQTGAAAADARLLELITAELPQLAVAAS